MIRTNLKWVVCLACLLVAREAGAFGGRKPGQISAFGSTIQTEAGVPEHQLRALQKDFEWLKSLPGEKVHPELLRIMGIQDGSSQTLSSWLTARVHYLLSESFEPGLKSTPPYFFSDFQYPNPVVLPDLELPPALAEEPASPKRKVLTVMANIGGGMYIAGKMNRLLFGVRLPGIGRVPVKSPRVGIIQVGEGLFHDGYFGENVAKDSPLRTAFRMATFFHEARHSDGNGKSVGFSHGLCPAGHDYAAKNACDRNLNGPYTIGALIHEHFAANCTECSEAERESMRVMALESRSRLIAQRDGSPAVEWDATAEGLFIAGEVD